MRALRPGLRLALAMVAVLWLVGTAARMAFAVVFAPPHTSVFGLLDGFVLGMRYDLRVAVLTVLPLWLLTCVPGLRARLRPPRGKTTWRALWLLASAVWIVAYALDAVQFADEGRRLSAAFLPPAEGLLAAVLAAWASRPMLALGACVSAALLLAGWAFRLTWSRVSMPVRISQLPAVPVAPWRQVAAEAMVVLLALLAVHGRASADPLRWIDAVDLYQPFARQLALNPVQNLVDTWAFRDQHVDEARARRQADPVRRFLGQAPLGAGEPVSFLRTVPAKDLPPVNVVVVLLGPFAGHQVGALGNRMGATPSFDALAAEGLLFTRMMGAQGDPARGVFAVLTGLPDVSPRSSALRNPAAMRQQVIANEFRDHRKFYVVGDRTAGDPVRGLLAASIDDLEVFDLERLASPAGATVGVPDGELLHQAHDIFRAQQRRPFLAVVQLNGRSVPSGASVQAPPRSGVALQAGGFPSREDYDALARLDHHIGRFMAEARREPYAANTVFAFIGNTGSVGPAGAWRPQALAQGHTPFLIYAPGRVAPRRVDRWAQQVDVMPTLASLAGIGHRNTTLGRDLLDPAFDGSRAAVTFGLGAPGEVGLLVGNRFVIDRTPVEVFDLEAVAPPAAGAGVPSEDLQRLLQAWGEFPRAYADVALYLQTHNARLDGR